MSGNEYLDENYAEEVKAAKEAMAKTFDDFLITHPIGLSKGFGVASVKELSVDFAIAQVVKERVERLNETNTMLIDLGPVFEHESKVRAFMNWLRGLLG